MRPGKVHDRRDVVFVRRVEVAQPRRRLALDQPVGADDALRAGTDRVVHHQQMVGDRIEGVAVAPARGGRRIGPGAHLLIEHAIAQRLHGIDFRGRTGDAHAEIAGRAVPETASGRCGPWRSSARRSSRRPSLLHGRVRVTGRPRDPSRERCRASLSRVACTGSRRRPNSSRRSETRSKPRRSAMACISRSYSGSWNSITLPVSMSIR